MPALTTPVAESTEPGALPSRLHQQGQVVGLGLDSPYVRFPAIRWSACHLTLCACWLTRQASADVHDTGHRERPVPSTIPKSRADMTLSAPTVTWLAEHPGAREVVCSV